MEDEKPLKYTLTVPKTARYFQLGEFSEQTTTVWFVLHGYGQLAAYFIKNFQILHDNHTVIVAPEGLHRFYSKGFEGRIGASWMTKDDREDDINDYVNYLELLYNKIRAARIPQPIKINLLGFSQGGATASRWLSKGLSHFDNLILWASAFPHDLNFELNRNKLNQCNVQLVIGSQDEYINETQLNEYLDILEKHQINFNLVTFEGKHEINSDILNKLKSIL